MMTVSLHGKKAAGRVALVDDQDYGFVLPFRWNIQESCACVYAIANATRDGRPTTIKMHTLITGYERTDHINHDGLDNRRENLRSVTAAQNGWNTRSSRGTSSKYKGVSWNKAMGRWVAVI